jgi:hypothetical protein
VGAVALTMTLSSALRGEPMKPNRRRANLIDRDTIEIRGRPPDLARNIERVWRGWRRLGSPLPWCISYGRRPMRTPPAS